MAKVDTRTLSLSDLETLRRRAVANVLAGQKQVAVARELGVRPATVCDWMTRHDKKGDAGLVDRQRGKAKILMTAAQELKLRRKIESKHPAQLKLEFALWTTDAVMALAIDLFRIKLSKRTVHRLLLAWGFTPKKGTRRAWQQDSVAVQRWIEEEYPAIARRAKRSKARVYWGDEMGVRSDAGTTIGWSSKGTPAIQMANGRRSQCNVISAINNQGGLAFQVFQGSFRVQTFIGFMKRLIRHAKGRKVFLILDQHPVHKSKAAKKWLTENKKTIEVFFMPGYSPELNPDEYLNNDIKGQTVRKQAPKDGAHLMAMVRGHLRRRQKQPQVVARFFDSPFVNYAAA